MLIHVRWIIYSTCAYSIPRDYWFWKNSWMVNIENVPLKNIFRGHSQFTQRIFGRFLTTNPPIITFWLTFYQWHIILDIAIIMLFLTTHPPYLSYVICDQPLTWHCRKYTHFYKKICTIYGHSTPTACTLLLIFSDNMLIPYHMLIRNSRIQQRD